MLVEIFWKDVTTDLQNGLHELSLCIASVHDSGSGINHRNHPVLCVILRVTVHIPLPIRSPSKSLRSLWPPFRTSRPSQGLDDPEYLTRSRLVRLVLLVVFVQAFLAALHQPQSLVDIRMLDDIRESQSGKCLRQSEDTQQCSGGGVRVGFVLLLVALGDFS